MSTGWHRLFAILALLTGCAGAPDRSDPQLLLVGIRTGPATLDPRLANDEATARVAQLLFSALLDLGPDLRPRPALAARLDNPDPLTYIAHLRHGVRFHDGHELTARDVVYTYESVIADDSASPRKEAFDMIATVSADDDHTVRFRLTDPFPSFPVQLSSMPIVPANAGSSLGRFPVGTGPYRFVRYDVGDAVELSAYEGYYDGLPNNSGILLKIIPEDAMRGLALRTGALDLVVNDMPPDLIHRLQRDPAFHVVPSPGLDSSYIGFNLGDPLTARRAVRWAIGYAIDRDAIIAHLHRGLARPASGLIPPSSWAFEPDVHRFAFDPVLSMRILDDAGFPDPDGAGPLPRFALTMKTSTNEETRLQATIVQHDLRRVGIDLALESSELGSCFSDIVQGRFQLFSLRSVGSAVADPDLLRRVFHSRQVPPFGFNRGGYRNDGTDRLLDMAMRALTQRERQRWYGDVQRVVARDAPLVPLWTRTNVVIARRDIDGVHIGPTGDFQTLRDARRTRPFDQVSP